MRATWIFWASALMFAGCESAADVIVAKRAGVERTFVRLQALAPVAQSTPPVEAPSLAARDVPLVLEGPGANTLLVYAGDLQKPGVMDATAHLRSLDSLPVLQCGSLLGTGQYFGDTVARPMPSVVGSHLEACASARYVLVVREQHYAPPELSLETKSFTRGRYEADVLVFDLSTGKALGGFPVRATNDDRVSLLDGDADHRRRLISNLESQVYDAIRAALQRNVPGSIHRAEK